MRSFVFILVCIAILLDRTTQISFVYEFTGIDLTEETALRKSGQIGISYYENLIDNYGQTRLWADITVEFQEGFFKPNRVFRTIKMQVNKEDFCLREGWNNLYFFYDETFSMIWIKNEVKSRMKFETGNIFWCGESDVFSTKGFYLLDILKIIDKEKDLNLTIWGNLTLSTYVWLLIIIVSTAKKITWRKNILETSDMSMRPMVSVLTSSLIYFIVAMIMLIHSPSAFSVYWMVIAFLIEICKGNIRRTKGHNLYQQRNLEEEKLDFKKIPYFTVLLMVIGGLLYHHLIPYISALSVLLPAFENKYSMKNSKAAMEGFKISFVNFLIIWLIWYFPNQLYNPFFGFSKGLPPFSIVIIAYRSIKWSAKFVIDQEDLESSDQGVVFLSIRRVDGTKNAIDKLLGNGIDVNEPIAEVENGEDGGETVLVDQPRVENTLIKN